MQREFEFVKHCACGWTFIIFAFGATPRVEPYAFAIMRVTTFSASLAVPPFDVSEIPVTLLIRHETFVNFSAVLTLTPYQRIYI